ncbi:hypothetical protein [Baekduia soli]|uniref:hypothetical protein n=1 Tax=Baekduia soli TaxID=496014 RepID=UPI00165211BB|nr:hypothetical protein [Baekduia soli]
MRRTLDRSTVLKELDGVADKLAGSKLTSPQRLDLLRRQAQLGDLRDALADRARREQHV